MHLAHFSPSPASGAFHFPPFSLFTLPWTKQQRKLYLHDAFVLSGRVVCKQTSIVPKKNSSLQSVAASIRGRASSLVFWPPSSYTCLCSSLIIQGYSSRWPPIWSSGGSDTNTVARRRWGSGGGVGNKPFAVSYHLG